MQSKHLYKFDDFSLDTAEQCLRRDGHPVALTPKAFETLLALVRRSGHLVEKERLLQEVWPDAFVEEAIVAQNVFALRKALGPTPDGRQYIETVPKRGYRFVADVREVLEDEGTDLILQQHTRARILIEEEQEDAPGAVVEPEPSISSPPRPAPSRFPWARRNVLIVLPLVLVIAVVGYLWIARSRKQTPTGFKPKSIAVLPFKQIGAGSQDELLGLGMADTMIVKLSNLQKLPVLPTSAVVKYTGRERDPLSVGRQLGVDAVLDGTVQHSGERVRVTVQLLSVGDGRAVWSDKFDEQFTNIFAVQDEISEDVAEALSLRLNRDEKQLLSKRYTDNTEAYQAYLMGLNFWNKRTKEGLSKAIEYFQRAIDKDPNYAPAYAGLADSCCLAVYYKYDILPREETYERAKAAATKALQIDDTLAEAHVAMSIVQWDYENNPIEAEKSIKRALTLNPNYATAHLRYGWFLIHYGRLDEAVQEMKRAQQLDPLSLTNNLALGQVLYFARQYDEAIKYDQRALEMAPDNVIGLSNLATAYEQKGMYKEALGEIQKIKQRDELAFLESAGYVYAMTGRREEAQKALRELEKPANYSKITPLNIALIYIALKQNDRAFEWLERAASDRTLTMVATVWFDSQFDTLRTDARFDALLRRHHLDMMMTESSS